MFIFYRVAAIILFTCFSTFLFAQQIWKGKIIDEVTKEPIPGATVSCSYPSYNCITNTDGSFALSVQDGNQPVLVSVKGYTSKQFILTTANAVIALAPNTSILNEVLVSANREGVQRSKAPVAIANISAKMLQETKPVSLDQVLNKVSGVHMVNLGNEQHQMSIRQPMTTKSLFLYLEDGIPIRTTGLFNHNALLEINMANVRNIEVIKGPSSSLYGSEAIGGVVNFISAAPTAVPVLKLSAQGNDIGYRRTDLQSSFIKGKLGISVSGYYAQRRNSFLEFTDYNKSTFTVRADYQISKKTSVSNSVTWMDYYSDMPGGIDSIMFASKTFKNPQTFTYRKVSALRYRTVLSHLWNEHNKTTVSLIYRDNTIEQNPSYAIKNDYKKQGNQWIGQKNLAHGEINNSSFNSYALVAQHKLNLNWKDALLIGGASVDISPSSYDAQYIRIQKDSISGKYTGYEAKDSILTHYQTHINNYASFLNFEFSPLKKVRIVASIRFDLFHYNFDNLLKPSSYSGSSDTINHFSAISPKIGFTYKLWKIAGVYANYSQGFVPPQVTEMYKGVKVPNLAPSTFYNYEAGGWVEIIQNKLSADVSAYFLKGTNEIISARLDDGSTENRNAGKTAHKGIEASLTATPAKGLSIRFSSALSEHKFDEFIEKGSDYSGFEMNGAPRWMHNTEIGFRPKFIKGLRLGAEWQHIGRYYLDPKNTAQYQGYHVLHLRAGYQINAFEVWVNAMNITNEYYAYSASKSTSGYSYTLAEPRHFNIGLSYDFGNLFKK
jgi:outer membrane receptor protein involved in Fe transport